MSERTHFFQQSVVKIESLLLQHPLANLFTGMLFEAAGCPLKGIELPDFGPEPLFLSACEVGRLFIAPDQSIVQVRRLGEDDDGTPAGFRVSSDNPFVLEGQPVEVVAYQSDQGNRIHVNNLHIRRLILNPAAPARFCTLAFGLMAVTAYRLGFEEITLFAAGRGPVMADDPDEYVGFMVWPKFGFDAPLQPIDLQAAVSLRHCASVQDVCEVDPSWWREHGAGREMAFDMRPESRSWRILINYLYEVLGN